VKHCWTRLGRNTSSRNRSKAFVRQTRTSFWTRLEIMQVHMWLHPV